MYSKQSVAIEWGENISKKLNVSNWVKQGGIPFLILFTIYLELLLYELKDHGLGFHIHTKFMAALAYADDIVLVAPSLYSLKNMLKLCDSKVPIQE